MDNYDAEKLFNEKLKPLIKQIKVLCISYRIPMFMTFAVKNNEEETVYKSDMVLAAAKRDLSDNRIGALLFQLNDYDMNEMPEWVKRDVEELEGYISKIKTDNEEKVDVSLKRDRINECNEITNKGGKRRQ